MLNIPSVETVAEVEEEERDEKKEEASSSRTEKAVFFAGILEDFGYQKEVQTNP